MIDLLSEFKKVEKLATGSKLSRLLANPYKYLTSVIYNKFLYKISDLGLERTTRLFFGKVITVRLPAGTDIYVTGGKSHSSELRLANYLIKNLKTGNTFVDVGAHIGYFSLLASEIVGPDGIVLSFEPAQRSFQLLQKNSADCANISIFRNVVSDNNEQEDFFELPTVYSEYNSINVEQYSDEKWFSAVKIEKSSVRSVTLDKIALDYNVTPDIIKIDVEGAEFKVLTGATNVLNSCHPIIIMEYLSDSRENSNHVKAISFLQNLGYNYYLIDDNGSLMHINNLEAYLKSKNLESDNLVFLNSNNIKTPAKDPIFAQGE